MKALSACFKKKRNLLYFRLMRQIVYVAAGVTHAPETLEDFVIEFKKRLRLATPAIVIDWVGKDSPVQLSQFYQRNINNVRESDVMIAIVDEPSIGLGMEIHDAISLAKPLICLHREDKPVSRLLVHASEALHIPLHAYRDMNHAVELAANFILEQDTRSIAEAGART